MRPRPGRSAPGCRPATARRRRRSGRLAWRMDRHAATRVALTPSPEFMPRTSHVGLGSGPTAWPMDGRPGEVMQSVHCSQCGRPNPEGARFCAHCGSPLPRAAGGERPGESTSTISLGGWESTETETADEPCRRRDRDRGAAGRHGPARGQARAQRRQQVPARQRAHHGRAAPGERHLPRRRDRVAQARGVLPAGRDVHRPRRGQPERDLREPGADRGIRSQRGDEVQVGKFRLVFLTNPHEEPGNGGARDDG